jgi:hypothetical protein
VSVFQPYPLRPPHAAEQHILQTLEIPYQLDPPIPRFTTANVQTAIHHLNPKKSPGYDLITGKILKELLPFGIKFLAHLFNAILLLNYFPSQWKVAYIILLLKPGKPPHALTSYRQISLLPIVSKVLEKLLLTRLLPIVKHNGLIPSHQFGFRRRHSTTAQTHRLIHKILDTFDRKAYCSAAFLDISQAFDKLWHIGLLYKLR